MNVVHALGVAVAFLEIGEHFLKDALVDFRIGLIFQVYRSHGMATAPSPVPFAGSFRPQTYIGAAGYPWIFGNIPGYFPD